ncbi:MAG: carbohydrate kinase family protein [Promethearchaeota archaeon]
MPNKYPEIISLGELLVEIMRDRINSKHREVGGTYRGPFPSGAPAIFIDSAARMGKPFELSTGLIGVIGNDEFGECILEKLHSDGVDTSQIRITNELTTGIAFNQYNSGGSRKFIFAQGAAGETSEFDVKEEYFQNIKNIHIMGSALAVSKQSREACYKAIKIAKEINPNVIVSFDPNLREEMLDLETILNISRPILEKTDILLPSGKEAENLANMKGSERACQQLLKMGPKIVILKQGHKGCTIFTPDKINGLKIDGFKVIEKDPTGAGDCFGGAFIVGYLMDWKLERIAKFANAVGALKVKTFGPMPNTSYQEVISLMT